MRASLLLLTAALLLAACVSAPTYAETVPVSYIKYKWNNNTNTRETVPTDPADCTMLTKDTTSLGGGWYAAGGTIDYEERLDIDSDVHLILTDGCRITAKKGIRLTEGASLTIYAQSEGPGTGRLEADNTDLQNEAAIGGDSQGSGTVTIFGGTVTAHTNGSGAAIGGGGGSGTVTIYGGTVSADAGSGAAIGGGLGSSGTVTIFGGTVTARTGEQSNGAAIGGGDGGSGEVTIYGGMVTTAHANGNGAAIGGGNHGGVGEVTIYGGTVTANAITDYSYGAAIGGGYGGGGKVTIYGGTVTARTGDGSSSAAIGGGRGSSGTVTIFGGTVTARPGEHSYGAAIGGGEGGGGTVTISGGTADASTGDWQSSAAIGGGAGGSGTVTISGGRVTARTGEHSWGPAIGGGDNSTGSTVFLGWTDAGDFVYANKYNGTVTLTKPFEDAATGLVFLKGTVSPDDITGKMLIPTKSASLYAWTRADFTLPDDLTGIGGGAFSGVAAKAVLVPGGVATVGAGAFAGSGMLKIRFLGRNTAFEGSPFAGRAPVIAFAPAGSTTLSNLRAMADEGVIAIPLD